MLVPVAVIVVTCESLLVWKKKREAFLDRKTLSYALQKDKAASLGVRLKRDKGGNFLSFFNVWFLAESDEYLVRPKPSLFVRSVNYFFDPDNDNGFSYDGRPQLSDPLPTSNPTVNIEQVPKIITSNKDRLSLRLEMLDKELLEIRRQILEGESETEDDNEIEEIIVPVPIRTDQKEPISLRGLWSSGVNIYNSTITAINEVESFYTLISTNSFTQLASKAAIYLDDELDKDISKLKGNMLGIKVDGKKQKLKFFEVIYDFTTAKNDEFNRDITTSEQDFLGALEVTIKETRSALSDITAISTDKIGSILVMLSNESWNVLLSKAISNVNSELTKELSAIKQYIITTDDKLEESLTILHNESWSELTNKAAISLDDEVDKDFSELTKYLTDTSVMIYNFGLETNVELESSLAMLQNEFMEDVIDLDVELKRYVLSMKEYIITAIKEKINAEIAAVDSKDSNGLVSIVIHLWSKMVDIRDNTIAIKNTITSLWVILNEESWAALGIKATIYLNAEVDKQLSVLTNYMLGTVQEENMRDKNGVDRGLTFNEEAKIREIRQEVRRDRKNRIFAEKEVRLKAEHFRKEENES